MICHKMWHSISINIAFSFIKSIISLFVKFCLTLYKSYKKIPPSADHCGRGFS